MSGPKKDSTYWMETPEDHKRLATNHYIAKDAADGKLILAPVDFSSPCRILDSATADGTWLFDLLATLPASESHTLIGTDLNPAPFPVRESLPANVSFQTQDFNKPWPSDFKESFDLVHQRLALIGAGSEPQACISSLFSLVRPGGWIQLVEAEMRFPEDLVNRHRTPAYCDLLTLMRSVANHLGAAWEIGSTLKRLLEAAGCVDIEEKTLDMMMGATNGNKELARNGVVSCAMAAEGLRGFLEKVIPKEKMPLEQGRLESLAEELRKELQEKGAVYPLKVVSGRRPE